MNSYGYTEEVTRRLQRMSPGTVFGWAEFADVAGPETIRRILKSRADAGTIERVLPGIFYVPKWSDVLEEAVPPSPDGVARAIAQAHNWTITPSGQVALNARGLSTQVPMTWTYVSDGPYRSYSIKGADLRFKHSINRETTGLSEITLLVIQALKALGKDAVGEEEAAAISRRLSDEEKLTLLRESELATAWVRTAVRRIADEG